MLQRRNRGCLRILDPSTGREVIFDHNRANARILDPSTGREIMLDPRRQATEEDPLYKLGWYTGLNMPKHVPDYDENEEKTYQGCVKQKQKYEDWRHLATSLKQKIAFLCCKELFSDFFITSKLQQDQHYPAHRFILALQSGYFQKLFYGTFQSENRYHQVDVSPSTIEKVLRYIYRENEPSKDNYAELSEIMSFADMYVVPSLSSTCEKLALEIVNDRNICYLYACHLFQTAYMLNLKHLQQKCLELYNEDLELFLSSEYFVTLDKSIVKSLYDFAIKTKRKDKFSPFLVKWCKDEMKRKPGSDLPHMLVEFLDLHL